VLGYYWTMLMYGRDFLAAFAQKYGNPFLDLEYAGDQDSQSLRERFEWMAKRAANQGYAVHPVGTKINVVPAQSMGSQNPTGEMMRTANEACQLLVLGQTLTTQVGDSGSRALGDVHMDVRDEKRQEVCKWVAGILTEQFVPTVLAENYGDAEECPTVEPDFAKPLTAQEKATLLTAVSSSRLPLPCEPLYRLLEMEKPEPGDQAVVGGEVVVVEEATTATDKRRQQMAEQLDFAAAAGGMEAQRQEQVQASWPVRVKSLAVKASREELLGVRKILARCQAASRTGRLNGEAAELEAAVKAIEQRNRP
jgi:phage gp29-like protein